MILYDNSDNKDNSDKKDYNANKDNIQVEWAMG